MIFSDVFDIGMEYFIVGIAALVLLVVFWGIGYGLLYKKVYGGRTSVKGTTIIFSAILICYMAVVLSVTIISRIGSIWSEGQGSAIFTPFVSYLDAWNSFSISDWRYLLLNILMFIPIGFLLPLVNEQCKRGWLTYFLGLLFTALIEVVQLLTGYGVFKTDDIINNFIGTMIGYGIYRILDVFLFVLKRRRVERNTIQRTSVQLSIIGTLCCQIPLAVTLIGFGVVFIIYVSQPYGKLQSRYSTQVDMSDVDLELDAKLDKEEGTADVYKLHLTDEAEAQELAQHLFIEAGVEDEQNAIESIEQYDGVTFYFGNNRSYSLLLNQTAGIYTYTNFAQIWDEDGDELEKEEDAYEREVRELLEELEIELPKGTEFENAGDGQYIFYADHISDGHVTYDGELTCELSENHKFAIIDYGIVAYESYEEVTIRSSEEAYEDILEGKFRTSLYNKKLRTLEITGVSLDYQADSRGYYQPVYVFDTVQNGTEAQIIVPAID